MNETRFLEVRITVPEKKLARFMAQHLLSSRLAASVQILGPIESLYRWKGSVHQRIEWLCQVKTNQQQLQPIVLWVTQNHPYDLAEIFTLPITNATPEYLEWIRNSVTDQGGQA